MNRVENHSRSGVPADAQAAGASVGLVRVVLPAFNEAANISRLIEHIAAAMNRNGRDYEIIVVDDGSTDGTADAVRAIAEDGHFAVTLIRHDANEGLGIAIQSGLQKALSRSSPNDVIVTMDSDSTHAPGLIAAMDRKLHEGYDVIIASRYAPGSRSVGVPFLRRLLSFVASLLFRLVFPISGVKDYTCGYRAYRVQPLLQLDDRHGIDFQNHRGFECMVYLLLRLREQAVIFGEVPILLRYDLKHGLSKMNVPATIWQTLKMIVQLRLGR